MTHILACVDFSDVTDRVLDEAAKLARALAGRITLVHVNPPEPALLGYEPGPILVSDATESLAKVHRSQMDALLARLKQRGVEAEGLLLDGLPATRILEECHTLEADMLVMGSHGHGAVYELLVGTVTESVLHRAEVPVLVVPAHQQKRG